jgi:hypothetical protein
MNIEPRGPTLCDVRMIGPLLRLLPPLEGVRYRLRDRGKHGRR